MAAEVSKLIKALLDGGSRQPNLAEVAAHFFAKAGGPAEVGAMLYDEYAAAKPGSIIRQRILDSILRMTRIVDERAGPGADLDVMSYDELQREFVRAAAACGLRLEPADAAPQDPQVHGDSPAPAAPGGVRPGPPDPGPAAAG